MKTVASLPPREIAPGTDVEEGTHPLRNSSCKRGERAGDSIKQPVVDRVDIYAAALEVAVVWEVKGAFFTVVRDRSRSARIVRIVGHKVDLVRFGARFEDHYRVVD